MIEVSADGWRTEFAGNGSVIVAKAGVATILPLVLLFEMEQSIKNIRPNYPTHKFSSDKWHQLILTLSSSYNNLKLLHLLATAILPKYLQIDETALATRCKNVEVPHWLMW